MNYESECVYVKRSDTDKNGYGVYAKKNLKSGDIISQSVYLKINNNVDYNNELWNYVFTYDDNNLLIVFGCGSLFNHNKYHNIDYTIDDTNRFMVYTCNKDINKDEELFINYGENHSVNKLLNGGRDHKYIVKYKF
jgi:SET domain-containing protein